MPPNWEELLYLVVYLFKLNPDTIWEMSVDDFLFWLKGIPVVSKYVGVA